MWGLALKLLGNLRSAPVLLAVGVIVALGLLAGWQTYQLALERGAHAETRSQHAAALVTMERAARDAELAARLEERRRAEALQGVIYETEQQLARARADADAAADAGDRLRQRIAQLTAACRGAASSAAAAGTGQTTDATSLVLADVQRRLDEATDTIARHADAARAAGLACQASYEAMQ